MGAQTCEPELGCWILSTCIQDDNQYICERESILYLTPYTGFVFSLIPILIGIGMLGGLGGGMIKRPVLNLLLNYSNAVANVITNSVIFASGLLNALILFFMKHTDHPYLPIINFEIAIIFNAAIPIAWTIGYTMSSTLPTIVLYIFQMLFLTIAIPTLWKLTLHEKKLEQDKRNQKILVIPRIKTADEVEREFSLDELKLKQYQKFYDINHSRFQIKNLILIFGGFALNQLVLFFKSTKNHTSIVGIQTCTADNAIIVFMVFFVSILYTVLIYFIKRNEEFQKDSVYYRPTERYYSPKKQFFKYYIGGFLAGFFAGFVGMGAGIIMVTVQLQSKIIAREAAATSGFSYFMISLNGLIQVIEQQTITIDQEMAFVTMAIIGVLVFTLPAYHLMAKLKVGYIVLVLDIFQELFNIIAIIFLIVIDTYLYGISSIASVTKIC